MSDTRQRFRFRLRHLFLTVTGLCALLASFVFSEQAFLHVLVFVVSSAMARISTRRWALWIVGPIFALMGGLIGIMSVDFLASVAYRFL